MKKILISIVLGTVVACIALYLQPYPTVMAIIGVFVAVAACIRLIPGVFSLLVERLRRTDWPWLRPLASASRSLELGPDECLALASLFLAVASITPVITKMF